MAGGGGQASTVIERVAASGTIVPGAAIVVGLSGGRDSLCLLDVVVRLAGADAVLAVHVHHGLRGVPADRDAERACAAALRLGAAARVVRLTVPEEVRTSGGSPAVWARDARRRALRAAADRWGAGNEAAGAGDASAAVAAAAGAPGVPVAVAHTASDQAETVLLRAISSPGTRALAGIALHDERRGVVRPLLAAAVTRAEAGDWCAAQGLSWRDDGSNPTGPRGRVRALLAGLEAVDGRAVAALGRTATRAREDDDALRQQARTLVAEAGGDRVPRDRLVAAPVAVGRRALRLLAEAAVGRSCSRVEARLEEVLALEVGARGRAALDLGDGVRAVLAGGVLRCEPSPPGRPGRSSP